MAPSKINHGSGDSAKKVKHEKKRQKNKDHKGKEKAQEDGNKPDHVLVVGMKLMTTKVSVRQMGELVTIARGRDTFPVSVSRNL